MQVTGVVGKKISDQKYPVFSGIFLGLFVLARGSFETKSLIMVALYS